MKTRICMIEHMVNMTSCLIARGTVTELKGWEAAFTLRRFNGYS